MTRILLLIMIISCFTCHSLEAQEKATPKNGEGIELFLKRFGRNGANYRKEFIRLNKGKFGKNNSLKLGVKYTLPPLQKKTAASEAKKKTKKI